MGLIKDTSRRLLDVYEERPLEEEDPKKTVPTIPPPGRHKKTGKRVSEAAEDATLKAFERILVEVQDRLPEPVRMPVEMVQEAWRQGARGRTLALWVAAAAATAAVAVRIGPQAAVAIPAVIKIYY